MFIKFRLTFFSLIYFLGLESLLRWPNLFWQILALLILISLWEIRRINKNYLFLITPPFFVLFSVALLRLIALFYEQQVFILLSVGMYYLMLLGTFRLGAYDNDQTAKGMLMAVVMTTVFFVLTASYGFYLYLLVPPYVLMAVCLISLFLLSFHYFSIIKNDCQKVFLYSVILALIMAEIIWTMNFWPFGYLTTGVIALILYYVLWDLVQSHFLNLLSRKRVLANMFFFSLLIVGVLLTAKWIPVIN